MARPRKTHPASDLFADLSKKTEILEREMSAQRDAIERLKQLSKVRTQPLRKHEDEEVPGKRRLAR